MIRELIQELKKDREDGLVLERRATVIDCMRFYVDCNYFAPDKWEVYEDEYLSSYFEEIERYYKNESKENIKTMTVSQFLDQAAKRLDEELNRSTYFLYTEPSPSPSTSISYLAIQELNQKAIVCFDKVYIENHLNILNSYFCQVIEEEREQESLAAYTIIKRIPFALEKPINHFKECVIKRITSIASSIVSFDQQGQIRYIENLFVLRRKMAVFSSISFQKDPSFEAALDQV